MRQGDRSGERSLQFQVAVDVHMREDVQGRIAEQQDGSCRHLGEASEAVMIREDTGYQGVQLHQRDIRWLSQLYLRHQSTPEGTGI